MKRIQLILDDKDYSAFRELRADLKKYYPKMKSWEDFFRLIIEINRSIQPPEEDKTA